MISNFNLQFTSRFSYRRVEISRLKNHFRKSSVKRFDVTVWVPLVHFTCFLILLSFRVWDGWLCSSVLSETQLLKFMKSSKLFLLQVFLFIFHEPKYSQLYVPCLKRSSLCQLDCSFCCGIRQVGNHEIQSGGFFKLVMSFVRNDFKGMKSFLMGFHSK